MSIHHDLVRRYAPRIRRYPPDLFISKPLTGCFTELMFRQWPPQPKSLLVAQQALVNADFVHEALAHH